LNSGGLELLFNNRKEIKLDISPEKSTFTLRDLISFLARNELQERPELFIQQDTVRPGILVLVNDTDWELCDGLEYPCEEKDTFVFISTLHGG
jgi:ubiquitin related modifier 1